MRIPDPQLDYHANRFIAQRISAHGITFEQYLTDPARYDALALEPEPLLPAQRAVGERWARHAAAARDTAADGCPHCDASLTVCLDNACATARRTPGNSPALCAHCCDD